MGSKLTSTGVTFGSNLVEQTKPVVSVNGIEPDDTGKITVPTPQSFIDRVEALEASLETSDVYAICQTKTQYPLEAPIVITHQSGTSIGAFDSRGAGSSDGFYVGTNYAIFYYAGAYKIKLVSNNCDEIPIKITMLSGGGGGAGGYQGQAGNHQRNTTISATNGSEDGFTSDDAHSVVYSENNTNPINQIHQETVDKPQLRQYVPDVGHGLTNRIDTLYGWSGAERQGVTLSSSTWPAEPPHDVYTNVYKRKQEPTELTGRVMKDGVEYLVYVGSGGDGGKGAGGNLDWDGVGGAGGDGGSGGVLGQGTDGSSGLGDGATYVDLGGTGGIGGGKSGASHFFSETGSPLATVDIDIFETQRNKSFDGFGQVGATGATGDWTHWNGHSAKTTGGGGGGGGGSNGIVLIEWGDF